MALVNLALRKQILPAGCGLKGAEDAHRSEHAAAAAAAAVTDNEAVPRSADRAASTAQCSVAQCSAANSVSCVQRQGREEGDHSHPAL